MPWDLNYMEVFIMDTNQQGMTIKEIAEIANVSDATVRGWIKSAETAGLSAKTADAQETKKPALFDLAEVIAIIRAGGRGTLADLLVENARQAQDISKDAPEIGRASCRERV
jgi:transposase